MNFDRIRMSIDVDRTQQSHIAVVGGGYGLAQDLVRCGVGEVTYIDFDRVDATNPARQDFNSTDFGQYKAQAIATSLKCINPAVEVNCLIRDFCELSQEEIDLHLGQIDLLIMATDFFPAQARGNLEALRLRKPAIWAGLYRAGRAGEIVFWSPETTPACYRCICSSRYRAFEAQAAGAGNQTHIPSDGGTIFDLRLLDAVAGPIALGLLTAGADNRFGRLVQQLGNRNLLQVKSDPTYKMGDKDIFAEHLGNSPANFSYTTIALAMDPERDCPDCARHRIVQERAA